MTSRAWGVALMAAGMLAGSGRGAQAQTMPHEHVHPPAQEKPAAQGTTPAEKTPGEQPAPDPHAGHGAMQSQPAPGPPAQGEPTQSQPAQLQPARGKPALPPYIAPITEADRVAAFPDVEGHELHDRQINSFVLFDQLEWQTGNGTSALNWDTKAWIGRDINRLWLRTEGEVEDGRVAEAEAHVLYGRAIARWWDLVAGVRQDMRPGDGRTWAAVGLQGLAPYWFEMEITGYVGESGRTAARVEAEYELLLTNRLIAQPMVEVELYGKDDPARGIGAGLSTVEAGLRLRYEFRREFAPYVGIVWSRKIGNTADFARAAGEDVSGARFVTGLRLWF